MQYSLLLQEFEKQMGIEPKQAEIARILNVGRGTISARANRNSDFSAEELHKLELAYQVNLNSGLQKDCVEIDYISITPSCGKGEICLADADVTPVKIGKELIKNFWNTKPENLKLFKASGDSMENTLSDNDVLLVDISKTDYHNGGIYILQINNDWYCKRLRLRMTGELDIISDNSKYPMETLEPNTNVEIKVIGRVIKNLSRGL